MKPDTLNALRFVLDHGIEVQLADDRLKCRVPAGPSSGEWRQQMASHKEALVQLLRLQGGDGVLVGRASFAQRRMWLVHQQAPASPIYNEPVMLRLHGSLNPRALEQALDLVMARHAVLRTRFLDLGDELCQVAVPGVTLPLAPVDLSHLSSKQADAAALERLEAQALRPFDLRQAPLARANLFRLAEDQHLLGMVWHHICGDHWSLDLLLREMLAHYESCVAGHPAPLPELPLQYADFARWQHRALQ